MSQELNFLSAASKTLLLLLSLVVGLLNVESLVCAAEEEYAH